MPRKDVGERKEYKPIPFNMRCPRGGCTGLLTTERQGFILRLQCPKCGGDFLVNRAFGWTVLYAKASAWQQGLARGGSLFSSRTQAPLVSPRSRALSDEDQARIDREFADIRTFLAEEEKTAQPKTEPP